MFKNYIDLGFIVLVALSLIFGLCGKLRKKFKTLLVLISSIVASYFTFGYLKDYLYTIQIQGQSAKDFVFGFVEGALAGNEMLAGLSAKVMPMLDSIVGFLVFWLEALVGFIAFGIIYGIIFGIGKAVKKHKAKEEGETYKPVKAVKSFGLIGLVNGFITWIYILLPILFLSPIIKNVDNVMGLIPEGTIPAAVDPIIDETSKQFNESKLIEYSGYIFTFEGNKVMEYKVGEDTKNVYKDLASVGSLTKAAGLVSAIMPKEGEEVKPSAMIEALKEMSVEDLTEVLGALEENKELITSIVPAETFTEMGIDIEEVNFKNEAPVLAVVLDVIDFTDEGDMTFDIEKVDNTKLANALVSSDLLGAVVKPGMLSVLPEENKTAITDVIDAKLTAGDIDQAKYDQLMAYFTPAE